MDNHKTEQLFKQYQTENKINPSLPNKLKKEQKNNKK